MLSEKVDIWKKIAQDNPYSSNEELAISHCMLGSFHAWLGQYEVAIVEKREAINQFVKLAGKAPLYDKGALSKGPWRFVHLIR